MNLEMENGSVYNKTQMIYEKMKSNSKDKILIENLILLNVFFESYKIDYFYIGSLAFQSFLGKIYRLPNDFDVVVMNISVEEFEVLLNENNIRYEKKLGRIKMFINNFSIHVLFKYLHNLNVLQTEIIHSLDFQTEISHQVIKSIDFQCSTINAKIITTSFELLFFSYLIRPLNTNIVQDIERFIKSEVEMNLIEFKKYCLSNLEIVPIVKYTLDKYIKLNKVDLTKIGQVSKVINDIF